MDIVEKLLSFKFRSGRGADEKEHDKKKIETWDKFFEDSNYKNYSYFDTFYNTLKKFKQLDTEYKNNRFDLETYIKKMKAAMSEFLTEMKYSDVPLSLDERFHEDYTKIVNFGELLIKKLEIKYKKLHERDVSTEPKPKRTRKPKAKLDDSDT